VNKFIGTGRWWMMTFGILFCFVSPALAQSGGVDSTFKPGFDNEVFTMRIQPDGKVLASGFFTKVGNAGRRGIARLNADGSVDMTFNPGTGTSTTNGLPHTCDTCALQTDGRVILGGRFQKVNDVTRSYLARLNSNGSLDTNFAPVIDDPFVNPVVVAVAIQLDGKIVIGGEFSSVNGTPRNHIARLNPDGSLDTDFDPGIGLNASPQAIALQTDGAVIIGGQFTTVNGAPRARVARLNANGSLDTTFDPGGGPNNYVLALSPQPNGKVVIGGYFTAIGGVVQRYVARLTGDGSLDSSFQPNIALTFDFRGVLTLQTAVDGKVLVAGSFATIDGFPRKDLARLNADGSLDTTFQVGSSSSGGQNDLGLFGIAIQQDGKVLICGDFTTFNGVRLNYATRLLADQGGSVEFASASYSADEGGNATIAVRRTGSTIGSVTVNYLTIDGTAVAGADYVAQAGALLFGPGETNKVFTVPILPDALMEPTETVNLVLGNPIGGVILGPNQPATLTIINNTNSPPNSVPMLPVQASRTVNELATLTVTNTATDTDIPANTLTYQLLAAPTNASISASGIITWIPIEAQGPSNNVVFTTKVIDDGTPPLSATNTFTVTVNEVNSVPMLPVLGSRTVNELATLTVTNTATDTDIPANTLTYQLLAAPTNASISAGGIITWTPTEAQGPSNNVVFTTKVTDDGAPALSATNTFTVTVNEVNSAPALPTISGQTINELTTLTVTNTATDTDLPANTLTYQLLAGPTNASISANGIITWTPTEAQGPSTNTITTVVTDNGVPAMSVTNSFAAIVQELNSAPVLSPISDQFAFAGLQLTITNSATDMDFPANILTFSLDSGAPVTAVINPTNGVFTWTPASNQAPGTNTVTVRVTDNGVPSLGDSKSFRILVVPPPVIESITASNGNVTITWSAIAEKTYRVQFKPDLTETGWNALSGDVMATGSTATKTDTSVSGNQRFYRVLLLP
jgi:uncharacterized delta-60 repeat protein